MVGATVDFEGIALGEVSRIAIEYDNAKNRFFAVVDATMDPERLGSVYHRVRERAEKGGGDVEARLLSSMIKHGLRGQLRTANLLTGQLYIVLAHFPQATPVEFHISDPVVISTIPGHLAQHIRIASCRERVFT